MLVFSLCQCLYYRAFLNLKLGFCLFFLQECLLGLLGSKTVIYVTHQVEFLPAADLILVTNSLTYDLISFNKLNELFLIIMRLWLNQIALPSSGYERWKDYRIWKVR